MKCTTRLPARRRRLPWDPEDGSGLLEFSGNDEIVVASSGRSAGGVTSRDQCGDKRRRLIAYGSLLLSPQFASEAKNFFARGAKPIPPVQAEPVRRGAGDRRANSHEPYVFLFALSEALIDRWDHGSHFRSYLAAYGQGMSAGARITLKTCDSAVHRRASFRIPRRGGSGRRSSSPVSLHPLGRAHNTPLRRPGRQSINDSRSRNSVFGRIYDRQRANVDRPPTTNGPGR